MRILITGGLGGIGSTLGHYLYKGGHKIIAYDNLSGGYIENSVINGSKYCKFVINSICDFPSLDYVVKKYEIEMKPHENKLMAACFFYLS